MHNHDIWPGCDAFGIRNVTDEIVPQTLPSMNLTHDARGIEASKGLGWQTTPYGGYCFNFIREGVYIDILQPWLRVFDATHIYVYTDLDLKSEELMVFDDLVKHATKSDDAKGNHAKSGGVLDEHTPTLSDDDLFKTLNATGKKLSGIVPTEDTIKLLKDYYQSNNFWLNKVLGKNILSKYEYRDKDKGVSSGV